MNTPYDTRLPPDLAALKQEIEGYARGYGLDFYETIFEVIDAEDLNEIAAYGGFPTRYPHWSFGMQFEELKKGYDYGLSKIYEMVINNDPCYAYLMRSNHTVDQKLVMAHVYGHCLAPETEVETEAGIKRITDVKVGDRVLTHTGVYRRVRAVARRYYAGPIYRVRVEGADVSVRITGEHPVGVLRDGELKWLPAVELRGGMLVASSHVKAEAVRIERGRVVPAAERIEGWTEQQLAAAPRMIQAMAILQMPLAELQARIEKELEGSSFTESREPRFEELIVWDRDERGGYAGLRTEEPTVEEYDGYVYNFSVEEDESYTLAAGFAVHNCDFFKHNAYFAHTSRKMMDEMANHGARIRGYAEKYGEDEVETFVDRCMSIDDLIDIHSVAIRRREPSTRFDFTPEVDPSDSNKATRFRSKDYMDEYVNPRSVLKAEEEKRKKDQEKAAKAYPEQPEKDVLLFLIENAPLKNWQRDVLSIIRDEAYYFMPQGMTKVMNEGWACADFNTLVYSNYGVMKLGDLVQNRLPVSVSDGEEKRPVTDYASFPDRETISIRTRRGLNLTGSTTHRVRQAGGDWKRLDELAIGDRVIIGGGADLWADDHYQLTWQPRGRRMQLEDVAREAGVPLSTVYSRRYQDVRPREDKLDTLLGEYDAQQQSTTHMHNRRRSIRVPDLVDERLGSFLGYLIGDGHISEKKRTIGLTTGDEPQAEHFADLVESLFGIHPVRKWDKTKWRIKFSSRNVQEFLQHLGLKTGYCAREKTVPDCILRSPKPVVVAFLRALYDCDGYAGKAGVILSTSSTEMSKVVQLLLLNFGILSTRRPHKDGCWHVHTMGQSATKFLQEIGFGLQRKQDALRTYVNSHQWFKQQDWSDEIVSIERGRADVYDITVETTHRYAAQGFINHNSYWHSTIMTQKALTPSEVIDYADHHSGTMAMSRTRLNPYKLGIELLRDIEHRWNTGRFGKDWDECDDIEKKRTWDKQLGLGRKKIFEVRRIHNDITFIDTFLTPEFCVEYNMFSYAYQEQAGQYYIESRDFEKIKQRLLFSLTNFGKPWIYVVDGNYRNRGELLLRHQHSGVDLRLDQAADTLANVQFIWGRPVHLSTFVDGKLTTLTFDGTDHSTKSGGEPDDSKRPTPAKTR